MQKPSYNSQYYDWYDRWWHPGTACPSYYTDKTNPIHPMFPNPLDHPVVDKWTQDELMRCHYYKNMRNIPGPEDRGEPDIESPSIEEVDKAINEEWNNFVKKSIGGGDLINHPPHYTSGKIEVWDFIIDQGLDFVLGNVIKYVCRAGRKGDRLEDLMKAKAYLEKAISLYEEDNA